MSVPVSVCCLLDLVERPMKVHVPEPLSSTQRSAAEFTSQLCAVGVTYLRFGTRDQSVRSKDLIASVPDGRGNTTGPIGPAA